MYIYMYMYRSGSVNIAGFNVLTTSSGFGLGMWFLALSPHKIIQNRFSDTLACMAYVKVYLWLIVQSRVSCEARGVVGWTIHIYWPGWNE